MGDILRRLSKNAVRNHENIRLAGEGGVPEAQGTQAYNYGQQAQHDLQGYLNQIPGVPQAQHLMGQFSNSGSGGLGRRETSQMGGDGPGYTPPQGFSPAPMPSSGESASYFQGGNSPAPPTSSYGQPSPAFPGSNSPFAAPPGPPPSSTQWSSAGSGPSFPSGPLSMPPAGGPPPQSGYAPSYQSPPAFPGAELPGGDGYGGGFAPPLGPPAPGFPGTGPGFSDPGAPPAFPGAHPHGHHGHHSGHHPHQQQHGSGW
jgi:hypothetical protein